MAHTAEQIAVAFRKACSILGLSAKYETRQLREAYLKLAKLYHPDSGSKLACAEKFAEIENAYHFLKVYERDGSKRPSEADVKSGLEKAELDELINKHTSAAYSGNHQIQPKAQHRANLTFEFKNREFTNAKVARAYESVGNYRVEKALQKSTDLAKFSSDLQIARKLKISSTIERVVEDLVQEAISTGQFDNLRGVGQPLRSSADENPLVDTSTHYLNKVLIQNGYLPEWVTLRREIIVGEERAAHRFARTLLKLDANDANFEEAKRAALQEFHDEVSKVNKKIRNYNILVPLLSQQLIELDFNQLVTSIQSEPQKFILSVAEFEESEATDLQEADKLSLKEDPVDFKSAFRQFQNELGRIMSYPFRRHRTE